MRAETEIRVRIDELDKRLIEVMKEANPEAFEFAYSDIWDEELALYWTLGYERKYAACLLAEKFIGFIGMSDTIAKQ